ncbi:AI-2E family transporter, partial [Arsenicicoccus piscis]|uniref:AI-2E family transporter n=1 Tax=Arsenicicoccus piscis TaxID=673954 RepID=UPI0024E04C24
MRVGRATRAALGGIQAAGDWATRSGIELPSGLLDSLETHLRERIGGIASGVGTAAVTTLTSLGTLLTVVVLAIFLTIFGLTSGDKLWNSIRSVVPVQRRSQTDSAFRGTVRTARGWMFASTVTGLVDGLFIGLGLWILGVPLALPIGALTFVLGYVPMVGATLA